MKAVLAKTSDAMMAMPSTTPEAIAAGRLRPARLAFGAATGTPEPPVDGVREDSDVVPGWWSAGGTAGVSGEVMDCRGLRPRGARLPCA